MNQKRSSRIYPSFFVSVFLVTLFLLIRGNASGLHDSAMGEGLKPLSSPNLSAGQPNCRFGVYASHDDAQWADFFDTGWYMTSSYYGGQVHRDSEFYPTIHVSQDKLPDGTYLDTFTINPPLTDVGLGFEIDNRPAALWVVSNEPDRGPNPPPPDPPPPPATDDTFPDVLARAYHDVYEYIKGRDPAAQVGMGGLVEVTPGRVQYLDLLWDAYDDEYGMPMPVDFWTMHVYVLPEADQNGNPNNIANIALGTNPALAKRQSNGNSGQCLDPFDDIYCFAEHDNLTIFEQQVVAMRTWMKDHGQRQKPLLLSEWSQILKYQLPGGGCFQDEFGNCFTPQRVTNFMIDTINYFEDAIDPNLGYTLDGNRLIQQWLWFSVYNGTAVGDASNLIDSNDQLTMMGQEYQSIIQSRANTINLIPVEVNNPVLDASGGGTVDADLTVSIRNNGNTRAADAFEVTFYRNSNLTQVIGTAIVPAPSDSYPGMTGCTTRFITVGTTWDNLSPGTYPFWVKVDSGNDIPESDEGDNVITGTVLVTGSGGVYIPIVLK